VNSKEVNQGEVEYEAFTKIKFIETYKKQSGGRGKFGDIVFRASQHEVVKFQKDYTML
jgi:elongation factor G